MNLKLFFLSVLCVNHGSAASEGFYSIVASQVMQIGEKFRVVVYAKNITKKVDVEVGIKGDLDSGGSYEVKQVITLKNDRSQLVDFDMKDQQLGNYWIETKSADMENLNHSVALHLSTKKFSVFVQTDKAIYKPSDVVQFRVLVVDSETKPFQSKKVEVFISDGAKNRVKQFDNVALKKGIFQGELLLSDEPVLGDWSINVKVDGKEPTQKGFEVAEYVLPKFEVIVSTKRRIRSDEKIVASFTAQYTYGKKITKGTATITTELINNWWEADTGIKKLTKVQELKENQNSVEIDVMNGLDIGHFYDQRDVSVTVSIKDELTGQEQNSSAIVTIHEKPFTVEIISNYGDFKPGFPLALKIVGKDLDEAPVTDFKNPATINITYVLDVVEPEDWSQSTTAHPIIMVWRPPKYVETREQTKKYFSHGVIDLNLKIPQNVSSVSIEVEYQGSEAYYWGSSRASQSKEYIQLKVDGKSLTMNRAASIEISSNTNLRLVTYIVFARGKLLLSSTLNAMKSKKFNFKFLPSFEMIPRARLLVFYVTESGEIISDSVELEFADDLKNFVDIELAKEAKPGELLNITLRSRAKSFVGLLGVDQSVLLLKRGNDIEKSSVIDELNMYGNIDRYNFESKDNVYYSSYTDFWMSNALVITNAKPEYHRSFPIFTAVNAVAGGAQLVTTPSPAPPKIPPTETIEGNLVEGNQVVKIRKEFPETWLFESIDNVKGLTSISKKAPDTITSWIITGFSLDSFHGLGLTKQPSKLKVFQPFFVNINLPYSIKRGEVLSLQVLAFNYLETTQAAEITLFNNLKEFEFVDGNRKSDYKRSSNVTISPESGTSIPFMIRPLKVGHITIKVVATSNVAGDGVERQLIVEPEGVTQYMNKAVFVDLRNNQEFKSNISISIPPNAVPDSTKIEASAIGDILGPSIDNLDKLIKLPYGCGEQNMLNFVPNIVVLDYLTALNKLTPEIESKAKKFMESGYQRELTYKHDDGSYSAFGKNDQSGSTWLTAFVAKSFNQAAKHILVDKEIIKQALNFLSKVQTPSGSFAEVGHVSHKEMQGGSSNGIALTAYTLITFLEYKDSNKIYQNTIDKALENVAKNLDKITDNYSLAIATYALHLAKHRLKNSALSKLDSKAVNKNGLKYWERQKSQAASNVPDSINSEMTGYALLAFLEAGRESESVEIMKWLIAQRNENGGFQSTQDTVVGLQALSKLAAKIYVAKSDIEITLSSKNEKKLTIKLNDANALVLQSFEISPAARNMDVSAKGKGFSILQISYKYNLNNLNSSPRFALDVKASLDSSNILEVNVCTSFVPDSVSKTSNMAVLEVSFPSGFTFDSGNSAGFKEVAKVKRIETKNDGTIAVVYFDNLTAAKTCLDIKAFRSHNVAEPKPASVAVYDYYDSSQRTTKLYSAPVFSTCDACGTSCKQPCN